MNITFRLKCARLLTVFPFVALFLTALLSVPPSEVLRLAGYRTGAIGKWSLGVHPTAGTPLKQGFEMFYGHQDQDQAHFYYPDHLWDGDRVVLLTGNRGERKQQYTHDLFTERALKFVGDDDERPFFLYLAYTLPHWSDYPRCARSRTTWQRH